MNRFIAQAALWWSGRTVRERRLLLAMIGLLLATIISLGVVRPVLAWRAAAADRAETAAATLAEVRVAVAAVEPVRPAGGAGAEGLEPLLRRTAGAAGVEVVTVMSVSGRLGFQLSRVGSAPLFVWLSALETDHGLTICSLGVTENADATLNVAGAVSNGTCTG